MLTSDHYDCFITQGGSAEISLTKGQHFKLTTDKQYFDKGDKNMVYVDYTNITKVVPLGGLVYVDDGLIQLKVLSIGENHLLTEVQNDAKLGSKKGVNLPNCAVDLPAVSEQDKKDILFGVEQNVSTNMIKMQILQTIHIENV